MLGLHYDEKSVAFCNKFIIPAFFLLCFSYIEAKKINKEILYPFMLIRVFYFFVCFLVFFFAAHWIMRLMQLFCSNSASYEQYRAGYHRSVWIH